MTSDEIIKKENEIAAQFQKVVDTHIVDDDGLTVEEMCCDDSEAISELLSLSKKLANYHTQIADVMNKYQKIEQIIRNYDTAWEFHTLRGTVDKIREVIKDDK